MNVFKKVGEFIAKPFARFRKPHRSTKADDDEYAARRKMQIPAPPEPARPVPKPQPPTQAELLATKHLRPVRQIGRGTYGKVWLAENTKDGRYVALKVVERDPAKPDIYERELNAVLRLRAHGVGANGLVAVGAPWEFDGFFAYEMPLADDANGRLAADGGDADGYEPLSLKWKLDHAGPLSVAKCVEIGLNVVKGVEELHRSNLVHRDIKPSNVVYIGGKAVLADVGLVATPDPEMSQQGTEGYVAGEGVGAPRADIYAVGKLLYTMATGFPGDGEVKVPEHVSDPLFVRLQHVYCIAVDKEDRRYVNTKALRAALEDVLKPEPILADEMTIKKWIRLAAKARQNRHQSDSRGMIKYKLRMRELIDDSVVEARGAFKIVYVGPHEFGEVAGAVIHEIERRLGVQPKRVLEVCNLAQYLVGEKSDTLADRLRHKVMVFAGRQDAVRKRREARAIKQLSEGIEHAIDELWEQNQSQFTAI